MVKYKEVQSFWPSQNIRTFSHNELCGVKFIATCPFCIRVAYFFEKIFDIQLGEYQKDLEYRLHHRLSKFYRSVFLILKPISNFFRPLYGLVFLSRNYWSSLDHDWMASICMRKSHFNSGWKFESYYSCNRPAM